MEKKYKQKFKKGDRVKIIRNHQVWSSKKGVIEIGERVGKIAIIQGSYNDMYGDLHGISEFSANRYSIKYEGGGGEAWLGIKDMELL